MVYAPIWKDTYYTTTANSLIYTINTDGVTIFSGKAYKMPGQSSLKININKVAQDLFEAYYPFYKDAQPLVYENNGDALYMENHYAIGTDDSGRVVDDVYVVFIDKDGNYYEPMSFEVPNYFK